MHFSSAYSLILYVVLLNITNAALAVLPRQSTVPKLVVAHHIVGLTAAYTLDDWKADISLAQSNGIDGFALNIGPDPYTPQQVENAFQAAEQLGSDFKLFFSFDMSVYPGKAATDAEPIRNLTLQYAERPNQLQVNGKALVSTFSGESCDFGHDGDVPGGWRAEFTQHSDIAGKVHFMPSFFVDPATFGQYAGVMDGDFNFNSGWPLSLTTASVQTLLPGIDLDHPNATDQAAMQKVIGSFDSDNEHISGLASVPNSARTYMAAVSPWFFTHFGADTYNKNWVYDCDEHLWVARWETLIANRTSVDLVQILTWNDFGESSYVGPKRDGQPLPPGSDAWVDGFDHTGWLGLVQYFATAFKTGQYPAIETDQLVMWARPHPKDAAPPDPIGPPRDFELLQDRIWVVLLAAADGELTLYSSDANSQTMNVIGGTVNKLSIPLTENGYMRGVLSRNGQTVIDLRPEGFVFDPNPPAFNFNAFVANASSS